MGVWWRAIIAAVVAAQEVDQEAQLAAYAESSDVTVLESGLMYKVLKASTSDVEPASRSTPVVCHYEGKLLSGEVFDSSYKRGTPATFAPSQVIAGWTEALQLMRPGDKYELMIPPGLAYGSAGAGSRIPGNSVLLFTLEVIEVKHGQQVHGGLMGILLDPAFNLGGVDIPGWALLVIGLGFFGWSNMGGGGKKCSARHILVKTEGECKAIQERIAKGEDFGKLAAEASTCPSGKSGGSLGSFSPGSMVPAFDKVCFDPNTKIGEIVGPVQTQFGYHLLVVDERSGVDDPKSK
mmetsp:Transcript_2230/g.4515  ORF Transcript_2230/g.4515 Transcript_2230/m.4515 type:complete len:293 (+) Transcript_2230:50-928(+)